MPTLERGSKGHENSCICTRRVPGAPWALRNFSCHFIYFFWGGGCHLEPYLNGPVIWNDSKEKCYGTVSLATYSNVKPLKTLMEAAPFIRLSPSTPLTLGQLVVPLRLFPRWCLFSESQRKFCLQNSIFHGTRTAGSVQLFKTWQSFEKERPDCRAGTSE